mgnify:CR=1 FL=1
MKRKSAGTWQEHAPGYYEPPPTSFEQDPEEPPEEEPDLYGEYLLGDKGCTACKGTGKMGGATCAHCEEEEEEEEDDDAWEARRDRHRNWVQEEDEDIARDKRRWPEEADFE